MRRNHGVRGQAGVSAESLRSTGPCHTHRCRRQKSVEWSEYVKCTRSGGNPWKRIAALHIPSSFKAMGQLRSHFRPLHPCVCCIARAEFSAPGERTQARLEWRGSGGAVGCRAMLSLRELLRQARTWRLRDNCPSARHGEAQKTRGGMATKHSLLLCHRACPASSRPARALRALWRP